MYPIENDASDGNQGTNHQNDDSKVKPMEKNEPAKKSFLAFLGAVSKHQSRRRGNRLSLDRLARPEVREELAMKGVAVLSDN